MEAGCEGVDEGIKVWFVLVIAGSWRFECDSTFKLELCYDIHVKDHRDVQVDTYSSNWKTWFAVGFYVFHST